MFEQDSADLAQDAQGYGGCKEPFEQARMIADIKQMFHSGSNSRGEAVLSRGFKIQKAATDLTGRPDFCILFWLKKLCGDV